MASGFGAQDGSPIGSFRAQLQPASFRGVPFVVVSGSAKFGRRNAVHEYPFRDTPWVEDLGKSARRITLTGFLVGDDVIAQRDKMAAAAEAGGDGELVHPTLGRRKVALIEFSCTEEWNEGRVCRLAFSFIEQGQRKFPDAVKSGVGAVQSAAATVAEASATTLEQAAAVVDPITGLAREDADLLSRSFGVEAVGIAKLAGTLPAIPLGELPLEAIGQVSDPRLAAAARSVSLAQLDDAAAALAEAGPSLSLKTAVQYAAKGLALVRAVNTAAASPRVALRSLLVLAAFDPTVRSTFGSAIVDALRLASLSQALIAATRISPRTVNEGTAVLGAVVAAMNVAQDRAGASGAGDLVFVSLRDARAALAQAIQSKFPYLPTLREVRTNAPMPAVVLAHRLYGDASRAQELAGYAGAVHPAFLPAKFKAPTK